MGLRIPDRACVEQDVSCLTAACLVTRKDVFLGAAGFDEKLLIAFNDVDLCVRLRSAKWRLIWTPAVGRHDSAQRVTEFANAVALNAQAQGGGARCRSLLQSVGPTISCFHRERPRSRRARPD
jgi:hypothetical protein